MFLRFAPFDGTQLLRNTLSCLRMITCTEDTSDAASVRVPEAAMHEYHFPMSGQDYIRASGQFTTMQSEPKT